MSKIIKLKLLLIVALVFSATNLTIAQTRVFPDLDFENENYELYIFEGNDTFNLDKHFVVSDQKVIKDIAENWVGKEADVMYLCGYNYNVYIISGTRIIGRINYNSECKQARSSNGTIDVNNNPFAGLDKSQTFSSWRPTFESKEKACEVLAQAIATDSIYLPSLDSYEWKDYEGRFNLTIKDIKKEKEGNSKNDKGVAPYWSLIREKYPHGTYSFSNGYTNVDRYDNESTKYEYHCYIHSDEAFFEKFDMYEKYGWTKYDSFQIFIFGANDKVEQLKSTSSVNDYY